MENALLARVQAAAIDGRMRNYRTRQNALTSLFQGLVRHTADLLLAVQVDDECSKAEAQIIIAATLHEVREHYDRIDFNRELHSEFGVKRGEGFPRRLPVGIAYIIPDSFTLSFSVFSALAAAIEAGCCCVIELENTLPKTSVVVKKVILKSLDNDAFAVTSSRAPAEFLERCLLVDQLCQGPQSDIKKNSLTSLPSSRIVGVVDRTGDVELAAREISASRSAFGSRNRYAVDQVLVNEYVATQFVEAIVKELASSHADSTDKPAANRRILRSLRTGNLEDDNTRYVAEAIKLGTCSVVATEGTTTLIEATKRSDPLLNRKPTSSLLVIHKYTSLDDAIDTFSDNPQYLGALYLFAGLGEAKYLSQYIASRATFVNHIPPELSVGPAFAVGHAIRTDIRYTRDMFEEPAPEFVAGMKTRGISRLAPNHTTWTSEASEAALKKMSETLKPTGQGPGGAWGYFEQGLVIGVVVYLLPMVAGSIAGVVCGGVWAYRKLASK